MLGYIAHLGQRVGACWNGMVDGFRRLPADTEQTRPSYVYMLLERGREEQDRITRGFYKADRRLFGNWVEATGRWYSVREELRLAEEREAEARQELAEVKTRTRELDLELNPPGTWYCPPWAYRVAVLCLAALDFPLTFWAFQVYTVPNFFLFTITGLVVAALAVLGHFAGDYLRRIGLSVRWLLGTVLFLAMFLVISLTYLRETSLAAGANDPISVLASTLVFMGVTGVGFVLPALLSLHVRQTPWRADLRRAKAAAAAARATVRKVRRLLVKAERRQKETVADRQSELLATRSECKVLISRTTKLAALYAGANVRWRRGHICPPALTAFPELTIPDGLTELTWALPQGELDRR